MGGLKYEVFFMLLPVKGAEEIELWVYIIRKGCGKKTREGLKV